MKTFLKRKFHPKKFTILYALLLPGVILISSCRYGKPLLAAFKEKSVKQDTAKEETKVTKRWSFLCMRTGIHTGFFELTETYNSHHVLILKDKFKNSRQGGNSECADCPDRSYEKMISYNSRGKKVKIKYSVIQGGYGDIDLVNKTKILEKRDTL